MFWKQLQEISYKRYHSFCGQNFTIIIPNHHITFDPILNEKVSALETLWGSELHRGDLSLRACDDIPSLFQKMFPDSNVAKSRTMSRQKAY